MEGEGAALVFVWGEAGLPACSLQAGWPANAPQQTRCVYLYIARVRPRARAKAKVDMCL